MCRFCGEPTKVLETRQAESGTVSRRRHCSNGHRFQTYEVQREFISEARSRLARNHERTLKRIARWERDERIVHDPRSATEIARDLGVSEGLVRHIRKTHL